MIIVGFVTFLIAGIAIISWLEYDFYFRHRVHDGMTVFQVYIEFARERLYYLILAFICIVTGIIFGVL